MKLLRYLRNQVGEGVRNYFAPLKFWRHYLIVLGLLATAFIPYYEWFTQGYTVLSMGTMFVFMFWAMMSMIGIPLFALMFGQIYNTVRKYRLALIVGALGSLAFGLWMAQNAPTFSGTDGVVIVEDGQTTVAPRAGDVIRYPIWDEREFRETTNAYGKVETVIYTPCEDTLCATTLTVDYAFTEPFIATNTNDQIDYRSIVAVALIKAANVDGNTTPDTIAPAMCANINANLGLDAASACAVRLTFSAQIAKV